MRRLFAVFAVGLSLCLGRAQAQSPAINPIITYAGNGTSCATGDGGPATSASLNNPGGVAVDQFGNIYIVDTGNFRIRRVDAGTGNITTVAGNGTYAYAGDGGSALNASLKIPEGVAVDSSGNFFISDQGCQCVRRVDGTTGIITTIAGTGTPGYNGDGIAATGAQLASPRALVLDASGNLLIADILNNRIRRIDATTGIITTIAGTGTAGFTGDGAQAVRADLDRPFGVGLDSSGNIYIADTDNFRVRRVDATTSNISTLAGGPDTIGDGELATSATLNRPEGLEVDSAGNLFLTDPGRNRIRRADAATGIITTVAGDGNIFFGGDGGPATSASLQSPEGVAVDGAGNLFIADSLNYRIRRVDAASGIITTVAGTGTRSYTGDNGPATSATLNQTEALLLDGAGNLYIADSGNNVVRRVDTSGTITTVAGTGANGYSGDGGPATSAQLFLPYGIAVDSAGNLYIADQENTVIRRVDAQTGIIATIAGDGVWGYRGDGGSALDAELNAPAGLALDGSNHLYIGDYYNYRVRQMTLTAGASVDRRSLTFSSQAVGTTSAAQMVDLTSSGGLPVSILSITANGDFSQTNDCPIPTSPMHPGSMCTISVTFSPTSGGALTGDITVTDTSPDSPQAIILNGTGTSSSATTVSPSTLTFSPQAVSSTSSGQTVTVSSLGTGPLTISSISISGDFAQTNNCPISPSTLASGTSCDITVKFTPTSGGVIAGALTITDDAAGSPQMVTLSGTGVAGSVPTLLGPSPYLCYSDSPFISDIRAGHMYLETFEDGALSTPGVTASAGAPFGPGGLTDSVDCDDGLIDGSGTNGHSFLSGSGSTGITFNFNPTTLGGYPTQAGIVWTDSGFGASVTVEAFGPGGTSLGSVTVPNAGDNSNSGTTGDDQFLGVTNADGVSAIFISNSSGGIEVDHLQYGPYANAMGLNPVPLVNQPLAPTTMMPGGANFTLTVNGTGFVAGAKIEWNGAPLTTTFFSSSKLTAVVPSANTSAAGTAAVTVVDPGPGGGASNVVYFAVATVPAGTTFGDATGSPIALGAMPQAVTIGDFNSDAKPDLAISNRSVNTLAILLSNGDGTFSAAASPATGTQPTGVATGDFNGDGKLDLAVANYGSSTVTTLLGNNDGTFAAAPASSTPASFNIAVAAGDFNGDGKLDLAVTSDTGSETILAGNGDGTFAAGTPLATGSAPFAAAAGDFNGDNKLDLAIANNTSNNVTVFLGVGDGTFSATASPAAGSHPAGIEAGDFNADGRLDLVVANYNDGNLTILLGNGDGTFTASPSSPSTGSGPFGLSAGDYNGDGNLDIAVAGGSGGGVNVLLGNGNGTCATPAISAGGGLSSSVATGDFNGDGLLDFATANQGGNSTSILLQQLAGSPALSLSGANLSGNTLTMPTTPVNLVCTPRTLTLTNTGSASLSVSSIVSSDSTTFAITTGACLSGPLAPGANCNVTVTFHPATAVAYTGTLTITSDAAGSPAIVNLAGTGQPACPLASATATQRLLRGTDHTTFTVEPNPTCQATDQIQLACVGANRATCAFTPGTIQNPQKSLLTMQGLNGVAGNSLAFQVTGTSPDFIQRTLDLAVNFADFWFTPYPTEKTVASGERATFAVSVVPINGLTGQMNLTCSGAPSGGSCTVTPSTITVGQDAPVQVQVQVNTARGAMAPPPGSPQGPNLRWLLVLLGAATLLMALRSRAMEKVWSKLGIVIPAQARLRRLPAPYFLLPLLLLILTWASCGGGGTSTLPGSGGNTAGKYLITLTGTFTPSSGSGVIYDPSAPPLTHNVTMTLNVR